MSALGDIRAAVVQALEPVGIPVSATLIGRFNPPIAVLVPGSPFVDAGDTYGSFMVRHEVIIIVGVGTNEHVVTSLGDYVSKVVTAIGASDGLFLEQVSQPGLYQHGGNEYLSVVVSVAALDDLEE